ncbi:hypothetical protein NU10_13165 [Flavobacterium dauae]|uniref:hypothetical protein n=1 Tax=Flavobacterium dauae TaxID=1563479 RepID=UPI00101B382A|nr:hypothetical protein [Flavobacterium dauae]WLD23638.1 hypothetical protein NU10_13165 [Flavobacterium dauae]
MKENVFDEMKNGLVKLLDFEYDNTKAEDKKREILIIKEILHQYTFANRLKKKGALSYIIIDSLNLDYNLGDIIIGFDKNIY